MINKKLKKNIIKKYMDNYVHLGHLSTECHIKMRPYISSTLNGYSMFNLEKTASFLKLAGHILYKYAKLNSTFLFVGTNTLLSNINSFNSNIFYLDNKWVGGLLTNWITNKNQIQILKTFEEEKKIDKISKKEHNKQIKKINKLKYLYTGIKNMLEIPDVVIFINPRIDFLAQKECLKLGIPIISIIDSNCNPEEIPYPIPANNISFSSINFILNYLINKILSAYK